MARYVVVGRNSRWGAEFWYLFDKYASVENTRDNRNAINALLVHVYDDGYSTPKLPGDYEWFGGTEFGSGYYFADNLEIARKCQGNNLVVYKTVDMASLSSLLPTSWPFNGGISAGQDLYVAKTWVKTTYVDQAPCSRKCDLQISSVNIIENLGSWDIEVNTTTSFPSSEYSLDGVTYQADNRLNVTSEGTYVVWAKDANNCIQKTTVKVVSAQNNYKPKYIGTIKDNDNNTWSAVVEEQGYEGSSSSITIASTSGIRVKTGRQGNNKLQPILGSECGVSVNSETDMQFLDLFTGEANKYRLRLVKGAYVAEDEVLANPNFESSITPWYDNGGVNAWSYSANTIVNNFAGGVNNYTNAIRQNVIYGPGDYEIILRAKGASDIEEDLTIIVQGSNEFTIPVTETSLSAAEWVIKKAVVTFTAQTLLTIQAGYIANEALPTRAVAIDFVSIKPYNDVRWSGLIATDAYEEPYNCPPYDVDFVFYDGLGKLKELPLQDPQGENYTGIKSMAQVLAILLSKTGLLLDINVAIELFESGMNTADTYTPIEQAYINMDAFLKTDGTPLDCYTCLEMLLSPFGAQVYQRENKWWIVETDIKREDEDDRSYDYHVFNAYGSKTGTVTTLTELIEHTAAGADPRIRFVNNSQHMTVKAGYKEQTVEQTTGVQITLNRNSKFNDDGEESQVFAYWNDETGLLTSKTIQDGNNLNTLAYFDGDGYNTSYSQLFEIEPVQLLVGAKGARLQLNVNGRILCNTAGTTCAIRIKVSLGAYYLNSVGAWQTAATSIDIYQAVNVFNDYKLTTSPIESTGLMRIYVYQAWTDAGGIDVQGVEFKEIGIAYAQLGTKVQEPQKTKVENDKVFNYTPSNFKIGFGDVAHENASFMFRNVIYTDALGTRVTNKWYRRNYFTTLTDPTITNGEFSSGLTGWSQTNQGGEKEWEAVSNTATVYWNTDGEGESTAIVATTTNIEGFFEIGIHYDGEQNTAAVIGLVLFVNNVPYTFIVSDGTADFIGVVAKQLFLPANAEIKIKVYNSDMDSYGQFTIDKVTFATTSQPDVEDQSFLDSLNGLTIQQTIANKLLNAYSRPMQLITGTLATKNAEVKMGNIFRDSYNLNGTDFMITSLEWDVAMCEYGVELVEFQQANITDDWLLDEAGRKIMDESLHAITDEG